MGSEQRIGNYKIQYWNGSTWVDAYSGSNAALVQTDTFSPVTGSKIRLNILSVNGPMGPSLYEFEVYNDNLAFQKNVSVSNYYQNNPVYNGDKAVDGNCNTRWATDDATTNAWMEVDFRADMTFNKTVIKQFGVGSEQRIGNYKIQYWNGSTWVDAYSGSNAALVQTDTFSPVTGSKIRLNILTVNGLMGPSLYEFEVYND